MSATISVTPTTGAFTVSPTTPLTEATGTRLLSGLPYGADNYTVTYNGDGNPSIIVYKVGATTLKTRTLTYTGGKLTSSADT